MVRSMHGYGVVLAFAFAALLLVGCTTAGSDEASNRSGEDVAVQGLTIERDPRTQAAGPTTFEVGSAAQWDAAVRSAQPGDTIRLTQTINAPLQYRGPRNHTPTGASGTAALPITITAAAGVWIDPGNVGNNRVGLDLLHVDNVHVRGVRIRNSQFGLRLINVQGSASSPVVLDNNVITSTGHSALIIQGDVDNGTVSRFVRVSGNDISTTGRQARTYGEGIYIGYGSVEWIDETSDITVSNNHIRQTTAEGIDIKTGTRNIVVEGNLVHDLAPIHGGAISAHYTSGAPNPKPAELDRVVVRNNRIWNYNLEATAGSNDWAIWVGHGGVEIIGNRIWGVRTAGLTRGIRVRGVADFGQHPIIIQGNVLWAATPWAADGDPSIASLVRASGNVGPTAAAGTAAVGATHFRGPVPAVGAGGAADRGSGPGSGFDVAGGATTPTSTPDPGPGTAQSAGDSPTTTGAASPESSGSTTAPEDAPPTTSAGSRAGPSPFGPGDSESAALVPSTSSTTVAEDERAAEATGEGSEGFGGIARRAGDDLAGPPPGGLAMVDEAEAVPGANSPVGLLAFGTSLVAAGGLFVRALRLERLRAGTAVNRVEVLDSAPAVRRPVRGRGHRRQ